MICSHDSYTYMKSTNWFYNLFSCFWRCQRKTIDEQYALGVRCFDIRVIKKKDKWYMAHGKAKFNQSFDSLEEIMKYFKKNYKKSILRIILEDHGYDEKISNLFIDEADFIVSKYKDMIWSIYIKHPWTCIYKSEIEYNMVYYTCHLFNWDLDRSFIENIKHFDFNSISIKRWAKKHNVEITSKMIKDKTTIHLMDYIGIYPKNKEK